MPSSRHLFKVSAERAADAFARLVYCDTRLGSIFSDSLERRQRTEFHRVEHRGVEMQFAASSPLTLMRAKTFATKEPETLRWIDGFAPNEVLWDIGANVGLYSIYAAKRVAGLRAFAFEPSVFNLRELALNIERNGVVDRITVLPLPVTDCVGASVLNMSNTAIGGALSTFGAQYGHDGKPLDVQFRYPLVGITLDFALSMGSIQPNHLKIDVDGIEHLVLAGATSVLGSPALRSVLIEISDEFGESRDAIETLLGKKGFRAAAALSGARDATEKTWNAVWVRE